MVEEKKEEGYVLRKEDLLKANPNANVKPVAPQPQSSNTGNIIADILGNADKYLGTVVTVLDKFDQIRSKKTFQDSVSGVFGKKKVEMTAQPTRLPEKLDINEVKDTKITIDTDKVIGLVDKGFDWASKTWGEDITLKELRTKIDEKKGLLKMLLGTVDVNDYTKK